MNVNKHAFYSDGAGYVKIAIHFVMFHTVQSTIKQEVRYKMGLPWLSLGVESRLSIYHDSSCLF